MTERKKEYITDALGELEDQFIAETVSYKKEKFSWKYNRELAAAAACVAVLFLAVSAYRLMPLGDMNKANESAAALEYVTEAVEMDNKLEGQEEAFLYRSYGVQWEIISEETKLSIGYMKGDTVEIEMSKCMAWYSAEELFAMNRDIFMGTVTDKQVYHVTGGMDTYFTIVTVEVEDSIRGSMVNGDTCRIYLPLAKNGEMTTSNSLIGDLDKLELGSRAIFMPDKVTEDAGMEQGEAWLCYGDFADYYFGEGLRFLFLETEEGVSYETDVYEIPGGEAITLERVADYIRQKISE